MSANNTKHKTGEESLVTVKYQNNSHHRRNNCTEWFNGSNISMNW